MRKQFLSRGLPRVRWSAMALVLDFIYTDVITLTDENVGEVLQAASLLRLLGEVHRRHFN